MPHGEVIYTRRNPRELDILKASNFIRRSYMSSHETRTPRQPLLNLEVYQHLEPREQNHKKKCSRSKLLEVERENSCVRVRKRNARGKF